MEEEKPETSHEGRSWGEGSRADSKILNHTRTLSKVSAQKDKMRPVRMTRMFCLLALPFAISRCPDTEEEWTVNWC